MFKKRQEATSTTKPCGKRQSQPKNKTEGECYICGRHGHFAKDPQCPARGKTCHKCHLTGHFATVCKTTKPQRKEGHKVSYMNYREEEDEDNYAFAVSDKLEGGKVMAEIGGVPVKMVADSGASVNIIDRALWEELKKQKLKCVSRKSSKRLYPYGATKPLEVLGTFEAELKIGSSHISADFTVIEGKGEPLLGKESAMKVVKIQLPKEPVRHIRTGHDLVRKYPNVFEGIGKLKDYQLTLHINPEVKPVAQALRRPAFSLREKIEKKLEELQQEDIIEAVDGPTPWVNPVVNVPKPNGDVRLCVDMRCANQATIRERHPIPTVDEILQAINEGTVFSKLDLKCGYHQIELSEESREITTFVTHKGLFRYKRLMFGISSAPEKYQQVIQQVLQECEGPANISDDIVVHGCGREKHNKRVEKVLARLQEKGLTLNKEKCVFHMSQITFMGLVLSQRGIGPTEEKVKAVRNAREPESSSEVRSFLGLANYNAPFVPDFATVAEPLRQLMKKGVPFKFGRAQRDAFAELKRRLANAETLGYFNKDAKTRIIADASPVGLGAVLIQE